MDEATRIRLLDLNRRFYVRHARGFDDSRRHPWEGWDRAVAHVSSAGPTFRVLDVGCGNGRFGTYLAERCSPPPRPPRGRRSERIRYHGIDSSAELLARAERRLAVPAAAGRIEARLQEADVVRDDLSRLLGRRRYDLVAVFGLLHHVPGRSSRAGLLASLGLHLGRGGVLAVSLWRFDRRPRHREKLLPWSTYNESAALPIDPAQLESGDHLLTWAGDLEAPRYCHLVDDDEVTDLVESSSLQLLDRFDADGANSYLVLGAREVLC
jgi:SAM-dependent methyltransferase